MVQIDSDNNIELTRGDTLKVKVNISINNEPYTPQENDEIRFAMKRNYTDKNPLILKGIPSGSMILHLEPQDTKHLVFGREYVYDVQITFANGDVYTFIKGRIKITPEV